MRREEMLEMEGMGQRESLEEQSNATAPDKQKDMVEQEEPAVQVEGELEVVLAVLAEMEVMEEQDQEQLENRLIRQPRIFTYRMGRTETMADQEIQLAQWEVSSALEKWRQFASRDLPVKKGLQEQGVP